MEVRQSSAFGREKEKLTPAQIQAIADLFAVLAEPTRLRILQMLQDGPASVGQIVEALELGQANVSKHLGILLHAGILRRERVGNTAHYSIRMPLVFDLCTLVCTSLRAEAEARLKLLAS